MVDTMLYRRHSLLLAVVASVGCGSTRVGAGEGEEGGGIGVGTTMGDSSATMSSDDSRPDVGQVDCGTAPEGVDCEVAPNGGTDIEGDTPLGPVVASSAWFGTRWGVCTRLDWVVIPLDPLTSELDDEGLPIPHLSIELVDRFRFDIEENEIEATLVTDAEPIRAMGTLVLTDKELESNFCDQSLSGRMHGTLEVVTEDWDLSGSVEAVSCSRFGNSVPCE